jgi:hypothetical protein
MKIFNYYKHIKYYLTSVINVSYLRFIVKRLYIVSSVQAAY